MRAIAFILLLYAAVLITNQYSVLTSKIDFNLLYIWPQIVALVISYLIMNNPLYWFMFKLSVPHGIANEDVIPQNPGELSCKVK